MSDYLIHDLERAGVLVRGRSEIAALHGADGQLEAATLRDGERIPLSYLFLFLGAAPCTDWLGGTLALDDDGFVLTGQRPVPRASSRRACPASSRWAMFARGRSSVAPPRSARARWSCASSTSASPATPPTPRPPPAAEPTLSNTTLNAHSDVVRRVIEFELDPDDRLDIARRQRRRGCDASGVSSLPVQAVALAFGTEQELQLFVLLLSGAALLILAGPLRIPYPILLVLGGLLLGFAPGVPRVTMPPELVLVGILPPLLYVAAYFTGLRELRQNLRPISLLAIGLVAMTTAGVAVVAHRVADLPWAEAFILGAVVSPTDPIAATAIGRRLGVPHRLLDVIEGESLLNDGTALVLLRTAIVAAVAGTFSPWAAGLRLVVDIVGGSRSGSPSATPSAASGGRSTTRRSR